MAKKIPFITKEKVEKINETYETPFYLYDEKGIRENAKKVNEAFSWNEGYKEFFAIKANPNPFIIKILKESGAGVDCASLAELKLAKALGFRGEDIMFSSNETPPSEYLYARKIGAIINVDDFTHFELLDELFDKKYPETMSVRYNPGGVFSLGNGIMDNPGDAKYGMTGDQIKEAFKIMKERGVKNFGIHAFLASNTLTNDYYKALSKELFLLALSLKQELGVNIAFVNLSGGVGVDYKEEEEANDILEIGKKVKENYEEIFVANGMDNVSIYTEMGRFMMAPFGALVTKAIHKKHIYKEYIGVDACCVNLMRPAIYKAYHHISVLSKEDDEKSKTYDVVGSLCENNDKFAIDRKLPPIENGDYLFIHDAGAHGYAMGYNYNGKLKCAELLLKEDGSIQLIRRAETIRDYFATLDFCDILKDMDYDEIK